MSSEQREELRIALVMNGGVSLAVWMGGVSNEIFRVVTQQHPVYRMLLDMTRTTARVDVISGTSAGGVNGAAMSLALLYGGDFSQLRDVWLTTGAFADLLRPALGSNPGSLLMGEEFFLPHIQEAFESLAASGTPQLDAQAMPIDLRLTTTLLSGRQGHSVDDLGAKVHDVDYRACFHFRHTPERDDFARSDTVIPLLSRAARSTASFPFAFEPSLVGSDGGMAEHLKDAHGGALSTPRYVIDGGILDNKPFGGALKAIFGMHARSSVRRVMAYINPDPGDGRPGEPGKEMPSLASVLAASVLGIPQSQSISDQLQEIQDHNDKVRTRRDSVVTLVRTLDGRLGDLPGTLFDIYRKRRLLDTFEGFVYEELPSAAERNPGLAGGLCALGKHGREQLEAMFVRIPWDKWIPAAWPDSPDSPAYGAETWEWGLFPVEFAAKVLLDMLRKTQKLTDFVNPMSTDPLFAVPREPTEASTPRSADWQDPGTPATREDTAAAPSRTSWNALRRAMAQVRPSPTVDMPAHAWDPEALRVASAKAAPPDDDALAACWTEAYCWIGRMTARRTDEAAIWLTKADALLAKLNEQASVGQPVLLPADFEEMFAFLADPVRRTACGRFAAGVAQVIRHLGPIALEVSASAMQSGRLRPHDLEEAKAVQLMAAYFGMSDEALPSAPAAPEERARVEDQANRRVLLKLMQLEVAEFTFNDHDDLSADALIELVQISGNATSPLGGPSDARSKLLGLQLAHFGAFYKQSWRANDWAYGRLDGSERLVKILLNPDRFHRFYFERSADAVREIKEIAWLSIPSAVLRDYVAQLWSNNGYEAKLTQELAFLEDVHAALPDALPVCAAVVTIRLQLGVLREELPELLLAIAADRSEGADCAGPSEALLASLGAAGGKVGTGIPTRPFSPEDAHRSLQHGLIGGERLVGEAGSDLFTRTLTHTAATLQNLLASKAARLGPVSLLFASLKLPIVGFYFVARVLTRQSRTSAALHGGILAAGVALVMVQFLFESEELKRPLPGAVVTLGWAMLAYGLLLSTVRAPRTVGVIVFLATVEIARRAGAPSLYVGVAIAGLLALSIQAPWLQWVAGFLAIAFAAQWGSGRLPAVAPQSHGDGVLLLGSLVCVVLLIAMWQASPWSTSLERHARKCWQRMRRRTP